MNCDANNGAANRGTTTAATTTSTRPPVDVVILGASGQVGTAMLQLLAQSPHYAHMQPLVIGREQLDFTAPTTDATVVRNVLLQHVPAGAVVVNLAAYTAVDAAEAADQQDDVWRLNAEAPGWIAEAAAAVEATCLHVSTDYVFGVGASHPTNHGADPDQQTPLPEIANPIPQFGEPCNAYGRSKAAGEQAVLAVGGTVVRTSWVWTGPTNPRGDFVATMHRLAEQHVNPTVVADQWGRPTHALDLADALLQLSQLPTMPDIIHVTNPGAATTWCAFAQHVFSAAGHDPHRVSPISSSEYPTAAARPSWSVLARSRWESLVEAGLVRELPAWQERLLVVFR